MGFMHEKKLWAAETLKSTEGTFSSKMEKKTNKFCDA
jgi:hypothetical protein